ncbi:YHS domain-containing protein [Bergeyella cardium]|uniref:YHS domain-containing protein n=1 Tax=Bergeyella cardium TaxID=1585976 RepID=A0A6P1QXD9_9FLAO|nr:YHS domain-containing protein [Bergeyella cardium]QHN65541.1 YHS domain-containing protein [Bergeyella cardium]WHE33124.1 YHS domain-containing protein [Bergeyella cardium]WHF59774.1 YHS domain-containing protein [Bergeyella cardium]
MKNLAYLSVMAGAMLFVSCSKQQPEEHHHEHMATEEMGDQKKPDLTNVKVVNEIDPICQMKTAEHLKDTLHYKGDVYGFCSAHCKAEFKKDPEKYAVK